jgi:hypothetical protein
MTRLFRQMALFLSQAYSLLTYCVPGNRLSSNLDYIIEFLPRKICLSNLGGYTYMRFKTTALGSTLLCIYVYMYAHM